MKTGYLLLYLYFFCSSLGAQVLITGSLNNYGNSQVLVSKISSYDLLSEFDAISLEDSSFAVQLELDRPAAVIIDLSPLPKNGTWQRIVIFVDPGDEVHFDIDFLNRVVEEGFPICKFSGTNAAGHELFYAFQYFPLINHVEELKEVIGAEKDAASAYRQFLKVVEKDFLTDYREQLAQGRIDDDYFKNATDYIKTGIVSTLLTRLYRGGLSLRVANSEEKLQLIGSLLDYSPNIDEVNILAGLQFSFLTHCLFFEELAQTGITEDADISDTTVIAESQVFTLKSPFSGAFLLTEESLQEFFMAHYLLFFYQTMRGMAAVYDTPFSFFKAQFPDSKYLAALEKARGTNLEASISPQAKPRTESLSAQYFSKWEYRIIDEVGKVEDFSYSDKNIDLQTGSYYVDIWATWCQPCLSEMTHNYHADSLLDANKIERLYISIDEVTSYGNWMTKIDQYHLGGYHILAGEKLKALLSREFGMGNGAIQIPRYLFLKNGQIVVASAARPSELRKLHQQIEKLISP